MTKPPSAYRPDIDGLRAVAIIPVVLFHAFPAAFPGGYVGVDVFFVISGFLISGIIFKTAEQGTFSFADFYTRRVRRIFPALATALAGCVAIGWFLLLPNEFEQLGKHVLAGAAFVSNLALWREAGYFDTAAEVKPLLHLWSLGIEEQFYILWPVLVVVAWRWAHAFLLLVAGLLAASFAMNLAWVDSRPSAAFYLPMARFWELMVGSLLALGAFRWRAWRERLAGQATAQILTTVGAGLIASSWVVLTKRSAFPGWWALLPTVGTALIIGFGEHAWLGSKVLANRGMVYVGQISYPLYLWHWPLLVMGRLAGAAETPWAVTWIVALSVALAAATHRWVERPFRAGQGGQGRTLVVAGAMVTMALVGLGLFMGGASPRLSSPDIVRVVSAADEWDYPGRLQTSWRGSLRLRQQGTAGADTVFFVGDSNIEQLYPRAERLLLESSRPRSIVFATRGGCPPIPHVVERTYLDCGPFVDGVRDYARQPEVKVIVVGAQWFAYLASKGAYYYDRRGPQEVSRGSQGYEQALGGLRLLLAEWVAAGKKVYLVRNIPVSRKLDPRHMVTRTLFRDPYVSIDAGGVSRSEVLSGLEPVYDDVGQVAIAAGAVLISPMDSLCSEDHCPAVEASGDPIYKDAAHLRPRFVRDHVAYLDGVFSR